MPFTRSASDTAVERWLEVALRERHAAVWREPVPEALLKLLRDDVPH